jgi:DNA invertase Pin-like site-specific DNA recombinase
MKEAIHNKENRIESVYCWELSRLSRKPETLYKVKRELISNKIDLRIKDKNFRLLNADGELDTTSDLIFGIYITFCENEGKVRIDRVRRAKILNAEKGSYNGGFIKYGYLVNENTKMFEVNTDEAKVIKCMFELYSTGKFGYRKLHKELLNRGFNFDLRMIARALSSKEYTGELIPRHEIMTMRKGKECKDIYFDRKYPPIISIELFDKCRNVLLTNNINVDKSKNIYYANKLIKCPLCGHSWVAYKTNYVYRCVYQYTPMDSHRCASRNMINMNVLDTILWNTALNQEIIFIQDFNESKLVEWNNQIDEFKGNIVNLENQYADKVEIEYKKLRKVIDKDIFTNNEVREMAIKQSDKFKQTIEQNKLFYKDEIKRVKSLISEIKESFNIPAGYHTDKEISEYITEATRNQLGVIITKLQNTTDKERYDIVHKHIKEVKILDYPEITHTKQIDIYFHNDIFTTDETTNDETKKLVEKGIIKEVESCNKATFYYSYKLKDNNKRLFQLQQTPNGTDKIYMPITERFIRKTTKPKK